MDNAQVHSSPVYQYILAEILNYLKLFDYKNWVSANWKKSVHRGKKLGTSYCADTSQDPFKTNIFILYMENSFRIFFG